MRTLSIDIETYSSTDLLSSGVYRYAEAPDFAVLLFAYAWDDGPVEIVDLASGETLPRDVAQGLFDARITKTAFNANFERACLAEHYDRTSNEFAPRCEMNPAAWDCTMVRALSMGLPGSLDGVAKVLGLEQQKDKAGKTLINYFSKPCAPTRANNGRTRNLPKHDPAKWELFKEYCKQDVEVERAVRKALTAYNPPEWERRLWALDQRINDRGVKIDRQMVMNALIIDAAHREKLTVEAIELTGLANPNSRAQLIDWLEAAEGLEVEKLTKATVPDLIDYCRGAGSDTTRRVLEIRQELSKTSVKKYAAMTACACTDDRIRGLLQFCGTNHSRDRGTGNLWITFFRPAPVQQ